MEQEYAAEGAMPASSRPEAKPIGLGRVGISRIPYLASKRLLDIVLAAVLLIIFVLPMLMISLVVRLNSSGPALFRQVRLGRGARPFVMLKFRSMYVDADDEVHRSYVAAMLAGDSIPNSNPNAAYKLADDPRVTPVGSILRRTSLDELPQLLNVLAGRMSLVGPRPSLPWEADLFDPHHRLRFEAKPGITGLWQVSGRSNLTMSQALDLDNEYVRRRSLRLDLWILLRTLPVVVFGRGAT